MPVQDCKIDCKALETLKELGIDTSWLEAFDMNSPVFKKAELIDKTLQEAAELMSKINQDILNGDMSGMCFHLLAIASNFGLILGVFI